ncbi:MAG TPA: hypothetical protein PLC52_06890 [Anaerolineales bacterium]|nr:hypothetical protein [Anaerolineales bacterium]HRQ92575.1 hypothetical protein [Anaerolineales bacterium]
MDKPIKLEFESWDTSASYSINSIEWSPNGKSLIFSHRHELYLADTSTGEARKLFDTGDWVGQPCVVWSRNGEDFLFLMNSEICASNVKNGEPKVIGRGKRFCWSPRNSEEIIFWNDMGSFISDLYGNVRPAHYENGVLSPNGSLIIRKPELKSRVEICKSDGSNPYYLDSMVRYDRGSQIWADEVIWGQDNNLLVFWQKSDRGRIYAVNLERSSLEFIVYGESPKLSPDGKKVLYVDNRAAPKKLSASLLSAGANGSTEITMSEGEELLYGYAWSPSSDQVAYSRGVEIFIKEYKP